MTSIAVMNAKGGVGKSTLTMALAETLSAFHGKRVLMIDSDGQMNLSIMLLPVARLTELRKLHRTITGFLSSLMPARTAIDWRTCIADSVSDVDDARSLSVIAGDMDLTLVEREIIAAGAIERIQEHCKSLLLSAKGDFDLVLVDCAPGISVTTECWLRECEWHLIPVKPDVLAVSGIQYLRDFKQRTPDTHFAQHLGVVINMKQGGSSADGKIQELLHTSREMACFPDAIPMIQHIQKSTVYSSEPRSFQNKYPGEAGQAFRMIAAELLRRVALGNDDRKTAVDQSSSSSEQDTPKQANTGVRKALFQKLLG